jgi:catechol 2,3-dioxygenase-like lactoylglutathione lyase family enzyme
VDDATVAASTGTNPKPSTSAPLCEQIGIQGVHHVAVIVEDMARSMDFYHRLLGLPVNPDRPHDRLPYDGAWLMLGPEMIHLMELPNPDPSHLEFRPQHGGKDRHFCIGVKNLDPLTKALEAENIPYTASRSGRPAIFFRDPDCNTLEVVQGLEWRDENDRNLTL